MRYYYQATDAETGESAAMGVVEAEDMREALDAAEAAARQRHHGRPVKLDHLSAQPSDGEGAFAAAIRGITGYVA